MAHRGQSVIVNTASIDARGSDGPHTAYNVSKAAILAFTRQLATELAQFGIRVNTVGPGYTETPMIVEALQATAGGGSKIDYRRVSLGRLIKPAEIANGVAFLASGGASAITSTDLVIDGGTLANLFAYETLGG